MKTSHDIMRKRLLKTLPVRTHASAKLRQSEWSNEFEAYMRNRMVIGGYRYGPITTQSGYNYVKETQHRIDEYLETGNTELLVDVANLCLIEFKVGKHPKKHFESVDDGQHNEKE